MWSAHIHVRTPHPHQGLAQDGSFTGSGGERPANQRGAPLAIRSFILQQSDEPIEIQKPVKWTGDFEEADDTLPGHILWAATLNTPGTSQNGFIIKSKRSPGFVKYFVEGRTGVPESEPINGDSEAFPDCPDFFFDKPRFESMTM